MASKGIMRVASTCASALTVAYFTAFAIVTGLEARWLACGFSIGAAVAALLWVITTALSSVAARRLLHQRRLVQMKVIDLPSHQGQAPRGVQCMAQQHPVATLPDDHTKILSDGNEANPYLLARPSTRRFSQRENGESQDDTIDEGGNDIEESLLSSIQTSIATMQLDRPDGEVSAAVVPPRVAHASSRQMNPFLLSAAPADNGDEEVNTFIMSPPSSVAYLHDRSNRTERPAQPLIDNHSLSFTGHAVAEASSTSDAPVIGELHASGNRYSAAATKATATATAGGGAVDRRTSSYPVVVEVEELDGCLVNVSPALCIYSTILAVLVIWGASFSGFWATHCTTAALPALACPAMWGSLSALRVFYMANTKAWKRSVHIKCLDAILHWITVIVICVLSVGVYVTAFTLELVYREPYVVNGDHAMPTSVIAVSFLAPIPFFAMTCIGCMSAVLQRVNTGNVMERFDIEHRAANGRLTSVRVNVNDQGEAVSTRALKRGSAAPRDFDVMNVFGVDDDLSSIASMDDTVATLSSIVRSSIASGANSTLVSPMRFSVSRSLLLRGAPQNNAASMSVTSGAPGGAGGPTGRQLGFAVGSIPQVKTVTMLYIAYKDIFASNYRSDVLGPKRTKAAGVASQSRSAQHMIAANFDALNEALEDTRENSSNDSNAYILTAFEDALCLVWGLLPFSSDPVQLAVEKAQQVFKSFYDRPKPASAADSQLELVAAIVYAPHSLIGMVGNNGLRAVHFFNPGQHNMGAELLERGVTMYRTLPSIAQPSPNAMGGAFTGILMDSRSAHSAASNVLARPCGVICEETGNAAMNHRPTIRALKLNPGKTSGVKYTCMYDFLSFVNAKEEEWHLVVQRQETLGQQFHFLTEATQNLQRNNVAEAYNILKKTVTDSKDKKGDDNFTIAQLMLDDLDELNVT